MLIVGGLYENSPPSLAMLGLAWIVMIFTARLALRYLPVRAVAADADSNLRLAGLSYMAIPFGGPLLPLAAVLYLGSQPAVDEFALSHARASLVMHLCFLVGWTVVVLSVVSGNASGWWMLVVQGAGLAAAVALAARAFKGHGVPSVLTSSVES